MNVYMRTDEEARSRWFCEWSPDRMEDLLSTLKYGGGVYVGDSGHVADITYQFIHDGALTGAEIVVHVSDPETS